MFHAAVKIKRSISLLGVKMFVSVLVDKSAKIQLFK